VRPQKAGDPMQAREIPAAAEQLAGEPLRWTSLKAAMAATPRAMICASSELGAAATGSSGRGSPGENGSVAQPEPIWENLMKFPPLTSSS